MCVDLCTHITIPNVLIISYPIDHYIFFTTTTKKMKKSFKTEVFLTIPLILLAFCITCASLIKNQWVTGTGINNATNGEYEYNFGLFNGEKVRYVGGRTAFHVKLVCSDGYCIYSCGPNKNDRNNDITNILSNQPCDNLADSYFCDSNSEKCTLTPKGTISEGIRCRNWDSKANFYHYFFF